MRLLFVASVVSVLAAAATFACSSSEPTAAPADAGKDAKPAATTDDDDDTTSTTTTTTTDSDAGDPDADAGTTITTTGDAGHACRGDSTPEVEPNNDLGTATKLPAEKKTFSLCGQVASGDIDVFTFDTPDFNNSFGVTPSGDRVNYTIDIGDKHFDGFPNNGFGNINVGDKWVITVQTGSQDGRSYAVRFEFN